MNIVVLGPGAVGSLWAYSLHQAGHSVSLYSKQSASQLTLQLDNKPKISLENNQASHLQQADLVLVTVKAPQVISALEPLLPHIHSDCIIVLMHNGMGTAELVTAQLPNNPLVVATTTHGALRLDKQHVSHTGQGSTQLGGFNAQGKQCQFLQQVFAHALPQVVWNEEILSALWLKLAINCAINPLTALHQVNNGQLVEIKYRDTIQRVLDELYLVLAKEKQAVTREELESHVYNVIQATANNHSSMHQDIVHQRPSEIDFITGYLIQTASRHHISVPTNTALYQQIKQIEQSWTS